MQAVFWTSIALILYTYCGYAVAVWAAASLRGNRIRKSSVTPTVSVLIPCHNEAQTIQARIKNISESSYPRDLIEIIVVSDGSTDKTADLARSCTSLTVQVCEYPVRRGKAEALNSGMRVARGSIVVFADARQRFASDAISQLAGNFADPDVGGVSGELVLDGQSASSIGEGAGLYWKYEKWIRKNEGLLSSCVGATGAIFAIRRELWRDLPASTILDDVYTPMRIALAGKRIVFDESALAYDRVAVSARREFTRKVRTLLGNYQLCQLMPAVLSPAHPLFIQFVSHKILRLAAPIFFLLLLVSNSILAAAPSGELARVFYAGAMVAQACFYLSVLAGWLLAGRARGPRLLNSAYVFSVMNAAAIVGLLYFISGKHDVWARGE
jgi:biofilm PGA synthesis N-glycosyltransferase PgaC